MPEILHPSNDPQSPDNEVPHFEATGRESDTWVVILTGQAPQLPYMVFGPFDHGGIAEAFAKFLSQEVDPAVCVPLRSPTVELLSWLGRGV